MSDPTIDKQEWRTDSDRLKEVLQEIEREVRLGPILRERLLNGDFSIFTFGDFVMNSSGRWSEQKANDQPMEDCIFELVVGQPVAILHGRDELHTATVESAEKSLVTLVPSEGMPYMELAKHVTVDCANGRKFTAIVWDNRGGKLILKTNRDTAIETMRMNQ